ncbi:MAG: ribonuclease Z [Methanomassiliicoccales archaeon]|jgi:ribonuclease BN (tRNA processing enzyme)
MKVTFLGTNGWYDTETGRTTCVLIDTEECHIVLDAGNGLYKIDELIKDEKPIYVFLSHPHLDHISGFHTLNKYKFKQGIRIFGQPGTKELLGRIIAPPFSVPFYLLPCPVEVEDVAEGCHEIPIRFECRFLVHSTPCFGYRFEVDGKIVAFCTDTGVCANAIELCRDADLMIAECSFKPGQYSFIWPHLNPEDGVSMAKNANAKRLAWVHFDAAQYKTIAERYEVAELMKDKFKEIIVGEDDKEITV